MYPTPQAPTVEAPVQQFPMSPSKKLPSMQYPDMTNIMQQVGGLQAVMNLDQNDEDDWEWTPEDYHKKSYMPQRPLA
jgi:hypothetical protein